MMPDSLQDERNALEALGIGQYEAVIRPTPALEFCSPSLASLLGLHIEDIRREPRMLLDRIAPEQRPQFDGAADLIAHALEGPLEIRFRLPDESEVFLRQFGQITVDENGAPLRIRGFVRDVTPLTQTLRALRDSEHFYDILLEAAPFGIMLVRDMTVIQLNPAARKMIGVPGDTEPSTINLKVFISAADFERLREYGDRRVAGLSAPEQYELTFTTVAGQIRHLLVGPQTIQYEGEPAVLVSFTDITDRKRAEDELAASRTRFQAIVESAPEGLFVERDGAVLYANRACLQLLGAERLEEVIGKGLDHFAEEVDTPVPSGPLALESRPVRWTRLRARGAHSEGRFFERALLKGEFQREPAHFGILRDITTQVRFQQELQFRLSFESILSHVSTQFINARPEEMDAAINAALEMLGTLADADRSFLTTVTPDLRSVSTGYAWSRDGIDPYKDILADASLEAYPFAAHALLEDGLLHVPAVDALPPEAATERALFERQGVLSTIVLPLYSEGVWRGFFGFEAVRQPKQWNDAEIDSMRLAAQVFSYAINRKAAEEERRRLELQMQTAQKMESLGVLVGGIAHDFNNLLTGIMGNASMALQETTPGSLIHESMMDLEKAANHAAELVRQMLAYAGRGKSSMRRLNLNALVDDIGHLLRTSLGKKAALEFHFATPTPVIHADETQIRQVVMNLITNAAQAMGDEAGTIHLRTRVQSLGEGALRRAYLGSEAAEGEFAVIEVEDTGCGMTPETVARMFDPFYTTKRKGTGLGLAATLGIVKAHGGVIEVDTQPGSGSRFTLFLPLAGREAATAKPFETPTQAEASKLQSGLVLLVDDESVVRTVARRILERGGFTVVDASDGREGVERFKELGNQLVAIVLDIAMPEMDGEQAFLAMRAAGPVVPVVFSSGFQPREVVDRLLKEPATAFVAKPYRPTLLLEVIADLIAEQSAPT